MENLQKILKSFKFKDNLNSQIWDENNKMNPKVREKLLEISNEFINYLDVDIVVSDIIMTGSLANFNWSEYSDIDLHILADFSQFPEQQLPLYEDLFKLKKTIFNDKHNILIYGYEVELYVQNEEESHFSSGIFSVLNNEWINEPEKETYDVDTDLIKSKINQWTKTIDTTLSNVGDEPIEIANKHIDKLKEKLKKYRTCGLEKGGEYSDENLVFKALRRNGYIEKLFDFKTKNLDKKLSLKEGLLNELEFNDISSLSTYPKNRKLPSNRYFMVHHTAGLGKAETVVSILNKKKLGIQWIVDLDGKIYKTLPQNIVGAHVGNNSKNPSVSNSNTEGVEVVAKDDNDIKQRAEKEIAIGMTPRQPEAVRRLVKFLGYTPDKLIGHGQVSNNRSESEGQYIINYIRTNWNKPIGPIV